MSRSQAHMVRSTNYAADCKGLAEGKVAPAYTLQALGVAVVPKGPAGGPLQGSSLSGSVPASLPTPRDVILAGLILGAGGGPLEPPADGSV
jgi:hypothetical protein